MDPQRPDLSDSRDPIFSDFRDPMIIFSDSWDPTFNFSILGTRIGSLKRLKKPAAVIKNNLANHAGRWNNSSTTTTENTLRQTIRDDKICNKLRFQRLCFIHNIFVTIARVLRRVHTESGYGLRSGLWPTALFTQAQLAVSGWIFSVSTGFRLEIVLSRIAGVVGDGVLAAYGKTAVGHKPDRNP